MLPRPTSHSSALGPGVAGPSLLQSHVDYEAVERMRPKHSAMEPLSGNALFAVEPEAIASATTQSGGEPHKHTQ